MNAIRFSDLAGSLLRRISRWCGAAEISQRRITRFLGTVGGETGPLRGGTAPRTVAVVIPCYGHASFLPAALTSLAKQSRLPDEIIAVDDHSPDATGTILEEGFERLRESGGVRCTLLTNERNRGQAYSLNRAIAAAESELVMILNDDDYLLHDAIALMLDLFQRCREVVLIGGTSIHFCGDDQLARLSGTARPLAGEAAVPLTVRRPNDVRAYRRYNDLNMTHSGSCFLKSAWQVVGGYCPDKRRRLVPFSDRDFQLRVNALYPVAVSTQVPFSLWRCDSSVDQGRDS